jgi:hypothetical protein
MGINGSRTITITGVDGRVIVSTPTDKVGTETTFNVACDSPRCESRHGKKFELCWIEEEAAKNPDAVPDSFFHLLKIGVDPVSPKEFVFCSPRCVKDWLDYAYVPPQSPRERSAQYPTPRPKPEPTAEDLDAVELEKKVAEATAMSDATGFAE